MKLSNQIVIAAVAALGLGMVTAYGVAQPKPGGPEKKAPPAASAAADGGVACGGESCKHHGMECPMGGLSALADIKVETTKTGATLKITAKDASKVAEVQALASKMAEHFKGGGCPMMKGGEGHHPHEMMKGGENHPHEHHHGAPPAPPAPPAKK